MAKRFRCTNCQPAHEFVSEKRACPVCGIDATKDKKAATYIHPLRLHHYDPPHPKIKSAALNVLACDPTKRIGHNGSMGSGEAARVDCPACMESQAYKDAVKAGALQTDFLESEDEIIGVSTNGSITAAKHTDCPDCG